MKVPKTLIPLALFGLAFAGALVVLKRPDPPTAAPAREVARPARVASSSARASAEPAAALASSADAQPPNTDAPPSPAPIAPPMPAPVPESVAASDGPADSSPLAQMPAVPDEVSQAIDTLRDGTPDDRVLAIQSLAATGHSGRALSRVRQSLRFAASDQDPDVAARAQEAYDSLLKREDP